MPANKTPSSTSPVTSRPGTGGTGATPQSDLDMTNSTGVAGNTGTNDAPGMGSGRSTSAMGSTGGVSGRPAGSAMGDDNADETDVTDDTIGLTSSTSSYGRDAGGSTPDLQADANEAMNEAKTLASRVAGEAQAQAGKLAEEARNQMQNATEHVKGMAAEQKDYLAGQIGGVADAMDRVASDLEMNNAQSARYARVIADNAERLSDMVRDRDVDQLMAMAQDFGRRQPVVFVGAALLLGLAASRFLAASARRASTSQMENEPSTEDFMPGDTGTTYGSSGSGAAGSTYPRGDL